MPAIFPSLKYRIRIVHFEEIRFSVMHDTGFPFVNNTHCKITQAYGFGYSIFDTIQSEIVEIVCWDSCIVNSIRLSTFKSPNSFSFVSQKHTHTHSRTNYFFFYFLSLSFSQFKVFVMAVCKCLHNYTWVDFPALENYGIFYLLKYLKFVVMKDKHIL